MIIKRAGLFIGMLLALPMAVSAQVPDSHICREVDLSGSFILATMTETPKGQETPWFQQYHNQYLVFHPDHTYDFVASQHRIANLEELQKSIRKSVADDTTPITRKYTLDSTGLLSLYLNGNIEYTYRCMVMDKASKGVNVNDLELKGYSKQNTLLDKLFRRWP